MGRGDVGGEFDPHGEDFGAAEFFEQADALVPVDDRAVAKGFDGVTLAAGTSHLMEGAFVGRGQSAGVQTLAGV